MIEKTNKKLTLYSVFYAILRCIFQVKTHFAMQLAKS